MDETIEQDPLWEKALVTERPFTSSIPLIGRLIARFRAAWNSVSTKWYVRPLLQQQNDFNRLVVTRLHDQDGYIIDQDRSLTTMQRDVAQLTTQLVQMNRRLQAIDRRLAQLETPAE